MVTNKLRLTFEGTVYDIIIEDRGEVKLELEEERKLLPKPEEAADEERQ